jgi:arsenate reductase
MNFKILHNPKCSKSRETLELLKQNNIDPEIIEYLKEMPDTATLNFLFEKLGETIVRKKEPEFEMVKIDFSKVDTVLSALSKYPKLLERPIVIKDKKSAVIGRPPEAVLSLLK